jgi:hypothetical protein
VGQGVQVDARVGTGLGVAAERGGDHLGVVQVRGGAGGGGELGRELAEHQVLAAPLDQRERGQVPEQGGAAVAEGDLVAVGQVEQLGQPGPDAAHHRPHRGLAVAGAEEGGGGRGQGGHRLLADLGGAAAEAAVARPQVAGEGRDRGGFLVGHAATLSSLDKPYP